METEPITEKTTTRRTSHPGTRSVAESFQVELPEECYAIIHVMFWGDNLKQFRVTDRTVIPPVDIITLGSSGLDPSTYCIHRAPRTRMLEVTPTLFCADCVEDPGEQAPEEPIELQRRTVNNTMIRTASGHYTHWASHRYLFTSLNEEDRLSITIVVEQGDEPDKYHDD